MIDLRPMIVAKSDQLNADDLIAGPTTLTITDVRESDSPDQPLAIHWKGGDGRPYKPCKSMRRVMAKVWGEDGKAFIGHRMTVYRDDRVRFGADAVGGIRISHMSGVDRETTVSLMVTRGKKAPYTVRPLPAEKGDPDRKINLTSVLAKGRGAALMGSAALTSWWGSLSREEKVAAKPTLDDELKAVAAKADEAALNDFDADQSPPDPASEMSGPDESPSSGPDTFSGEEVEAGTARAPDVLSRVDTVIADFEFKSLAELKSTKEDRKFLGFVAAVRAQDAEAADRVEKALAKALESFG